jgi:hypothetical protein
MAIRVFLRSAFALSLAFIYSTRVEAGPASRFVALTPPVNSGVCGVCAEGNCPGTQQPFRCVHVFDPQNGALVRNVACDEQGDYRIELKPGRYVIDRHGSGNSLSDMKRGKAVEIIRDRWLRLDRIPASACPDSGIYGLISRPCWGSEPAGSYKCITVRDEKSGVSVATGQCDLAFPVFTVPLPPGHYLIEAEHLPRETVDVHPGRWMRLGVTKAPPCGPIP